MPRRRDHGRGSVHAGQRQRNGALIPKEHQAAHPNTLLSVGQKEGSQVERRVRTFVRWTQDEDARLREAVAELGKGKWGLVADRLGTGRTPSAVEQHWQVMTGQRKSPEYYAARRPAAKCKGPKAEGSLAQPQPGDDDCDDDASAMSWES